MLSAPARRVLPQQLAALLALCVLSALAAAQEPAPPTTEPTTIARYPLVSTVLVQADIRQALSDISSGVGVTIIADETVSGVVTADLADVPLDEALDLVLLPTGATWLEVKPRLILVTMPDPKSPNFRLIATTQVVQLEYIASEDLQALLPDAFASFVKFQKGGNRVTVHAPKDLLAETVEQIKLLDTQPGQVLIEALAVETTKDGAADLALNLQGAHLGLNTASGLMTYVGQTVDILHQVLAMVERGKGTIRANPRVLAQEGKPADIKVATNRYFQIVTGRVGYEYTTLESIEAAVSLNIVPRIAATGRRVTCVLKAEVSDVTGTGTNNLPIITSRTAQSTVTVGDGQVIAISGLRQEVKRERRRKVPILGDIPIIGKLFQSRSDESSEREIVIFVVPHILDAEGNFTGPLLLQTDAGRALGLAGSSPKPGESTLARDGAATTPAPETREPRADEQPGTDTRQARRGAEVGSLLSGGWMPGPTP